MLSRIRARLTYANVVATLSLFLVVTGGTAVALKGSNTVFSGVRSVKLEPFSLSCSARSYRTATKLGGNVGRLLLRQVRTALARVVS